MKKTWNDLTPKEKLKLSDNLVWWLRKQRLQNYGYDREDFKKMVNRASYLRRRLEYLNATKGINITNRHGIYNRLETDGKERFGYVTGQSFNEEYITLMECLTEKEE